MNKAVFEFQDYKPYLKQLIKSRPNIGRGFRAEIARAIGCQQGFVTKVLDTNLKVHLSLEQAEKLNRFLGHNREESRFFLILILYSRSGTDELRQQFREQMKEILNRRLQYDVKSNSRNTLSPDDHIRYYSAWYYAAIRIAVSIPELQTPEALSKRFRLPSKKVMSVLDFLLSRGLIVKNGFRYEHSTQSQICIDADNDLVAKHHSNWRLKALESLDRTEETDLHYSYVVTLSEHDALRIRSSVVDMIQDIQERAKVSKSETLFSIGLDFFEL